MRALTELLTTNTASGKTYQKFDAVIKIAKFAFAGEPQHKKLCVFEILNIKNAFNLVKWKKIDKALMHKKVRHTSLKKMSGYPCDQIIRVTGRGILLEYHKLPIMQFDNPGVTHRIR